MKKRKNIPPYRVYENSAFLVPWTLKHPQTYTQYEFEGKKVWTLNQKTGSIC